MKVSHAPVYRRRRRVAAVVVAALGLGSGYLAAGLVDAVRGDDATVAAPTSSPAATAPVTTPTITAAPDASEAATASSIPVPTVTLDKDAYSLTDPDSPWVVVNKLRPLDPLGYEPADLVQPEGVTPGALMRREAADALARMSADAAAAGAGFSVSTAYRSRGAQSTLYEGYVERSGQGEADRFSARPGYSEHQTGLAADINDASACDLRACFADTVAGRWVAEHAADYGFIVRYPDGKEDVTGYIYEPWHVRYVGEQLARELDGGRAGTLEEYFGLDAAPDYEG